MTYLPVNLAYEEHGNGTPVILVHGFPFNRSIWYPIVPSLEQKVRLILPDLRGHGQSPVPEGVYSMRLMAALGIGGRNNRAVVRTARWTQRWVTGLRCVRSRWA